MELLWIYYKGQKQSKYILFLKLGTRNGKMCGLDTAKVNDAERRKIVHNLYDVSLEKAIPWLRANCPTTYKTAYRELSESRIKIESSHEIDISKVK